MRGAPDGALAVSAISGGRTESRTVTLILRGSGIQFTRLPNKVWVTVLKESLVHLSFYMKFHHQNLKPKTSHTSVC